MYQRQLNYEEDLISASDPSKSESALKSILHKHYGEIKIAEAIALNPSCPIILFISFWNYMKETAEKNPSAKLHQSDSHWQSRVNTGPRLRYSKWSNDISRNSPACYKADYLLEHGEGKYQRFIMTFESLPEQLIRKYISSKSAPLRKVIAARNDLPNDLFDKLSNDSAKSVREVVASNPNTPPNILSKLARDSVDMVAMASINNPNCPDEAILEARLAEKNKAKRSDFSPHSLDFSKLSAAALDSSTALNKLAELANNDHPCIRFLVGINSNTSSEILEKLAIDELNWVRAAPAFNPATPAATLKALVNDKTEDVQIGLASNPNLSEEDQLILAATTSERVAYELANLTEHHSIYDKLIENVKAVKKAADKTWRHHLKAALIEKRKGKKGKFTTLQRGSATRHCFVSRIAASADGCSDELKAAYAYYCFDDFSKNPSVALAMLEGRTIVQPEAYNDWKIDKWLSEGAAPGFVARYFIKSTNEKRRSQALSSWTTPTVDILPFVLDQATNTRRRIAQRQGLIRFVIEILSRDEKPGVREQIARNINTPQSVLSALAVDKATTVRTIAAQRLKKTSATEHKIQPLANQGAATDRGRLAKNTKDKNILKELATDRAASVRVFVAQNYETPEEVIIKFADDSQSKIRKIAARRLTNSDRVRKMLLDENEEVRLAAANNRCWFSLAENNDKQYDQDFLFQIADSEDEKIRALVAEHISDRHVQQKYMKDVPFVTVHLARNKLLSDADKLSLAKLTDHQDTLATLARNTYYEDLFLTIAAKITSSHADDPIRCHREMLSRPSVQDKLCKHPLGSIRAALSRQETLTPLAKEVLLNDGDELIRRNVLRKIQ